MKHRSTRTVFDYWNRKRGVRAAPDRADIDPGDIRHELGDTFMLAADFADQLRIRLAGTRICALFCREIKGELFSELWSENDRTAIGDLLDGITTESAGAVAGLTAHTADGAETDLEMLILPLAYTGHARIRALGVLAPASPPYWIGARPVAELTLGTVRHIGPGIEGRPARRVVSADGSRIRHGFVVYSGGRAVHPGEKAG